MARYNFKRELRVCHMPRSPDWAIVDVPERQTIAVAGRGGPDTSAGYS